MENGWCQYHSTALSVNEFRSFAREGIHRLVAVRSSFPKNRFHVVAVRIEHEGGVIPRRVTEGRVTKSWRAVISSACPQSRRIKRVDFGAAFGGEGSMLLHAMGVKAVNPENRVIETIADATGPGFFRKLGPPQYSGFYPRHAAASS
jgi:hypothetical protein